MTRRGNDVVPGKAPQFGASTPVRSEPNAPPKGRNRRKTVPRHLLPGSPIRGRAQRPRSFPGRLISLGPEQRITEADLEANAALAQRRGALHRIGFRKRSGQLQSGFVVRRLEFFSAPVLAFGLSTVAFGYNSIKRT
jgi:hypothetical protein